MNREHKQSFLKDTVIASTANILIALKGIILLPILIKNLGVELYGGYTLVIYGIVFLGIISSFGVGFKFRRYIPSATDPSTKRDLFYEQFVFSLLSVVAISMICIFIQKIFEITFFDHQSSLTLYLFCGILLVKTAQDRLAEYFRYTDRWIYYSTANVVMSYLEVILIVVLINIYSDIDINALLMAIFIATVAVTVPLLKRILSEIGFKWPEWKIGKLIEDARLGFPLVLSGLVDFLLSSSDRFVISWLVSVTAVGYYNPAYTLGAFVIFSPKVFGNVLMPMFSRMIDAQKREEAKSLVQLVLKLYMIMIIPFVIGSVFLSYPLLEFLANTEVAQHAFRVTPIVATGVLFFGLTFILSKILFVFLKTKIIFVVNALSAGLNLALNIIFLSVYKDIIIAALATCVCYFGSFLILNHYVKRVFPIKYDMKYIGKCLIAASAMGVMLSFLVQKLENNILNVLLMILISIALYGSFLFILKVIGKKEISIIREFFVKGESS